MSAKDKQFVLFDLGFRVFFLSAACFAIISIALWGAIYFSGFPLPTNALASTQWHAHEMIYGYAFAVIAGFLLTAVKNWTGRQTIQGKTLILLFSLWATARILFFWGTTYITLVALFDILFSLGLTVAITIPIVQSKQWKQIAIIVKVLTITILNAAFYLGTLQILDQGIVWGIYGGLYLVVALVLTLGRRVLPFFIEKGVDYPVKLPNALWLDISSLIFMLGFIVTEVFYIHPTISAFCAIIVFAVNAIRLIRWHTPGIWQKSLLWSIYLAFWFICIGFALIASSHLWGVNKYLAIHAFAFGGIGVVTLSMMSRVSLGHTGRGIQNPATAIKYAFGILIIGAIVRVILPLLVAGYYQTWILLSMALWLIAFVVFMFVYLPILIKPRIDGKPG